MTESASAAALRQLADQKRWDSHPEQTMAAARSIYLHLPEDYRLWLAGKQFAPLTRRRLRSALAG
jgi:hypothetical protein